MLSFAMKKNTSYYAHCKQGINWLPRRVETAFLQCMKNNKNTACSRSGSCIIPCFYVKSSRARGRAIYTLFLPCLPLLTLAYLPVNWLPRRVEIGKQTSKKGKQRCLPLLTFLGTLLALACQIDIPAPRSRSPRFREPTPDMPTRSCSIHPCPGRAGFFKALKSMS